MIEPINTEEPEICVSCGKTTKYKWSDNIQYRSNYIEGVGQLCSECDSTSWWCSIKSDPEWYGY